VTPPLRHRANLTILNLCIFRKEKKKCKKCKKTTKAKDKRKLEPLSELLQLPSLPDVTVPRTPSPFAVFAAVRATCLENRQRQAAILQLQSAAAWKEVDEAAAASAGGAADSSSDLSPEEGRRPPLPKIVGIGLTGVFEIIRESRESHPVICKKALQSLLNIVQGLQPEELAKVV
jgi:E3 ubiquitin-protein ligase MYCBP2